MAPGGREQVPAWRCFPTGPVIVVLVADGSMWLVRWLGNFVVQLQSGRLEPVECQSLQIAVPIFFFFFFFFFFFLLPILVKLADYDIHLASKSSARYLSVSHGESALSLVCSELQSRFCDMFCCSWTTGILTCQSARQGSQLHRVHKTTKNIHVSNGLWRIVTFWLLRLINTLTYLLTYLMWSRPNV